VKFAKICIARLKVSEGICCRSVPLVDGDENEDQIVESAVIDEISDEDLEAAAGAPAGAVPTLVGTYCFTCPPVAVSITNGATRPPFSQTKASRLDELWRAAGRARTKHVRV
jgi:hypothetical protein